MADLKSVAAGIFKEDRVVVRGFEARTFDVDGSCCDGNGGKPVHFRGALRPECDPVFVGLVLGGFRHAKEFRHRSLWSLKLEPAFNLRVPGEPKGWQERFVKRLYLCQTGYAEVNMIEATGHETEGGRGN